MEVTIEMENGAAIARLSGSVTGGLVAARFEEQLLGVLRDGAGAVVLDCRDLAYISSTGLRAILILVRRGQEQGVPVAAFGMTAEVQQVFSISGFDRLVDIHETLEEALAAVVH